MERASYLWFMPFNIAPYIDHTILKPTTTEAEVKTLCEQAAQYNFAAVCVPPVYVRRARKFLHRTEVKVATVIGFPLGYNEMEVKALEIADAIDDGADELDMVQNLTAVKNADWGCLEKEIIAALVPIHQSGKKIKIIVESGLLTDEELIKCCSIYGQFNVDFLKTSTGFAETGATVHAVQLMRANLPEKIAIKASGGIRNFAFAKELIDAGATRIGCSASVQIFNESREAV